jgi:hypothetical protein
MVSNMNNPFDNDSQQHDRSLWDSLARSLEFDAQDRQTPEVTHTHSNWQDAWYQDSFGNHPNHPIANGEHFQSLDYSGETNFNNFHEEHSSFTTAETEFNPYQPHEASWEHSQDNNIYQTHQDFGGIDHHYHQDYHQISDFSEKQSLNYLEHGDSNSVHIYPDGDVYWDSGGKAGHIDGQKFYNSSDHYIGRLGGDLKVYDAHDKYVGWVDPEGHAYALDGTVFAQGGTARWAAAVLAYNTCSPS